MQMTTSAAPLRLTNGFAATRGTLRDIAALSAEAEVLGYQSVWVAEVAGYDAVSMLMAAAAATSRIRLATGIAGVYLRDPLLAAMSANAINEYANGRLILGLGTSTQVIVERWHGIPWTAPLTHMRAYTALIGRLLAGERVSSDDGPYRMHGAQLTVPSAGPVPVVFGALGPRMLALAGEVADGVLFNFPSLSYARQAAAAVREAAARAGRDPASVLIAAFLRTTVTDAPEAMLPRYQSELLSYVMAPVYQRVFAADGYTAVVDEVSSRWAAGDRTGALAAIDARTVNDHNVIGDAAYCRAQFAAFREAGVDCPIVFPLPESEEANAALASIYTTITALAPNE
jgi:probable F420-dependent oxidoreductase